MDRLMSIANKHRLIVIEDCAESHGATCHGKMTGSFGQMACFSFYANKIITTGEGGMITTNDAALAEKLRFLRNLAFQKPRFYHEHAGYNFRMTGMQGALGLAQLRKIDRFIDEKRRMAALYNQHLADIPGLQLPHEADWAKNVYWMYGVVLKKGFPMSRDQFAAYLLENGVDTRTFFCPMNVQPFLREQSGFREVPCPIAQKIWENGLYLPSSTKLTEKEIIQVASVIRKASSEKPTEHSVK
jgi:perosamine synthetase